MPKIPDPETLVETAKSAKRIVEDREWKQYQRYLAKHKQRYGNQPSEQPISFEQFCVWLMQVENNPLSQ